MRKRACGAASILFSLSVSLAVDPSASRARAQQLPPAGTGVDADTSLATSLDLQLEVFINGRPTRLIAAFTRDGSGALAIAPDQLRNVGIIPAAEALRADGLVDISKLPGVAYRYDATLQAIYFDVQFDSISARVIDAHKRTRSDPGEEKADSSFGGLINYTIYGNTGGGDAGKIWDFQGLSGWFEGRVFSPYGVLSSSQLLSTSTDDRYDSTRLETSWSYSDPDTMTT
ncbi:MAG: fimbrial biogenesis outer membrane usher protein, partial [Rhizobiaceae bacterium]|nr:fimbrial biogenesis outer membrane usher protein [Rhizobiaceae bacterium]